MRATQRVRIEDGEQVMEKWTLNEALAYIHHVDWRGSRLGLSRIEELLHRMGNPEKRMRFIHVAGTNGKGSTSAMLAAILQSAGYCTGLYTSPFINRFNERMAVNGEMIRDDELIEITEEIRPLADAMDDHPTEFELVTAIGFAFFQRHNCEVVVLEVGMGGEFDATNVIPTPELAVITNIGLDHTRELGPTITDIAKAKAGIIKPGGTVVIYGCNAEADAVFANTCAACGATLLVTDHSKAYNVHFGLDRLTFDFAERQGLTLGLVGSYQVRNAAVALTAVDALKDRGWRIPETAVRIGLANVKWPARFEVLGREPLFIADGAHNPQGIAAAVESFHAHFPGRKLVFLLGVMADKDVPHMLGQLPQLALAFVTATPNNPRAMPAAVLSEQLQKLGCRAIPCDSVEAGVQSAIALAGEEGIVCALGSLYMLGDVRACMAAPGGSDTKGKTE